MHIKHQSVALNQSLIQKGSSGRRSSRVWCSETRTKRGARGTAEYSGPRHAPEVKCGSDQAPAKERHCAAPAEVKWTVSLDC